MKIKQTLTQMQHTTQLGACDAGVRMVAQQLLKAGANGLVDALKHLEHLHSLLEVVTAANASANLPLSDVALPPAAPRPKMMKLYKRRSRRVAP